jgi:hypothetical protein
MRRPGVDNQPQRGTLFARDLPAVSAAEAAVWDQRDGVPVERAFPKLSPEDRAFLVKTEPLTALADQLE